ncbi:hypothetical protein NKG95_12155 [Mesorhizobium sp. M1423]|uniref:hypothetical protein n=1 Tax=Mesorhizobium sp. M1423 TaxID=2957101 RepID=UPI003335F14E
MVFALSRIDKSPLASGETATDPLKRTVALVQLAERLSYRRFWVAEHGAREFLAGSSDRLSGTGNAGVFPRSLCEREQQLGPEATAGDRQRGVVLPRVPGRVFAYWVHPAYLDAGLWRIRYS